MSEAPWLLMLRRSADRTSIQAAADAVGFSRAMISLVLSGKYGKSTDNLERAVLARLDSVDCPHLSRELTRAECDRFHRRGTPQSDAVALRHWVACRRCAVREAALSDDDRKRRAANG